jgi:FkbM family methyltransferase
MKMSAKKAIADLYTSLASRPALQSLHAAVLKFTLYAMGIGYSEHSDRNGERRWLGELHRRLAELSRRAVIFDVGANVGDYAHEVSEVFGNRAEIHCFEPSRATFEELSKRTAKIEGVVLNQLGVGSSTTTATLYTDGDGSTLASLYPRDLERFDRTMDQTESIELVSVDDYCHNRSIERIDLLKLDIEGNELEALRGASQMIEEGRIDYIQLEFGATTLAARVSFHDIWTLLSPRFEIYRILKHGLHPIRRYEESCEIFMYQNLVAIRRK